MLEVLGVIGGKEPAIRIEQNVRVESLEEVLKVGQNIVMGGTGKATGIRIEEQLSKTAS